MTTNQLQETEVTCKDGRYVVDERLVRRIIESYYRAKANIQFGKAAEMDTEWFEPEIKMFEVDWAKARTFTEQQTISKLYSTWMVSLPNMRPRIDELTRMQQETSILTKEFRRKVSELEKESQKARDKMIDFWGGAAAGAKITRDISATTLMVGATVLSAGSTAALFAGGAGTTLRFGAKLQDAKGSWKDNIGAASVQAVGDLIFTFIPATKAGQVMRGAKGAQKATLVFIEAAWDSSVSLLEGKEVSEAVLDGSMSLLFSATSEIASVKEAQKELSSKLSRWMIPTLIRSTGTKKAGYQAAKTISGGAMNYAKGQIKSHASNPLNAARTGNVGGAISQQILKKNVHRNGLDNAAVVDQGLVARAVRRI
jgi:hypothetical protein